MKQWVPRYDVVEIRDSLKEEAEIARHHLIESIVETDHDLMEKYFADEELTVKKLKALRKATIEGIVVPVTCGTAFKSKGIQPLLDAIVEYMPSPIDIGAIKGTDPKTEEEIDRNHH